MVPADQPTITVINLLALIVVIVLLTLPAANQFFRGGGQAGEPPIPTLPYPPVQGYPGADPGYPPVPGDDQPGPASGQPRA